VCSSSAFGVEYFQFLFLVLFVAVTTSPISCLKTRLQSDLLGVEWDIAPYKLTVYLRSDCVTVCAGITVVLTGSLSFTMSRVASRLLTLNDG